MDWYVQGVKMKTEQLIIRKAREEDFIKIAEIYAEGFSIAPYKEKWTTKTASIKIKQYSEFCDVFTAEIGKEVIALAIADIEDWYDGKQLRFWEIVVKAEFRGHGIGKQIIKFIEDYYKKREIIRVIIESHKDSEAFNLYNKLGYKENGWVVLSKDLK